MSCSSGWLKPNTTTVCVVMNRQKTQGAKDVLFNVSHLRLELAINIAAAIEDYRVTTANSCLTVNQLSNNSCWWLQEK